MRITEEERGYLWLIGCTHLDYRARVAALRAAPPAELIARAEEIFPEAALSVLPPRSVREREADAFLASLAKKGYFAVTLLSEDYPEALKQISTPPLALFGAGNRELLRARKFCIVGSRITPPWAEKLAAKVSGEIASRFAVVTGLAEGGDLAAIEGAMPRGNLISVLPCGLDMCYPAAHASLKEKIRASGLLLSELLPGEEAKKYSFHARNRLLAGLAEGVLVVSAARRSGALITANCALDFGRDVFAFPHNVGSVHGEGCNDLIKKGAYLVTEAEDILSYYGFASQEKELPPLSAGEEKLLALLKEVGEAHLAVLAERAGMQVFEASAHLSALELKGLAVKAGGNRYAAV